MPVYGGDIEVPDISLYEFLWERLLEKGDETALVRINIEAIMNLFICMGSWDFLSIVVQHYFQIDSSRNGKSITFKEMHDQSKRCATYLQSQGIEEGDFVAICAPSCIEWSFLMIGIIATGATLAPCNPSYKKGEKAIDEIQNGKKLFGNTLSQAKLSNSSA